MFCNKCGKEILDDSEFCTYCGAVIGNAGSTVVQEPQGMPVQQGMSVQQAMPMQQGMQGNPYGNAPYMSEPGKATTSQKLVLVLLIIVGIYLALGIVFTILNDLKKKSNSGNASAWIGTETVQMETEGNVYA